MKYTNLLLTLLIIMFSFVSGLVAAASKISWDYYNYIPHFEQSKVDFLTSRFEPLYSLFMGALAIFFNYELFRFVESFLATCLFGFGVKRLYCNTFNKKDTTKIIFLLLLATNDFFWGARQGLAIGLSIFLGAYLFSHKKSLVRFSFCLLLPTLIHFGVGFLNIILQASLRIRLSISNLILIFFLIGVVLILFVDEMQLYLGIVFMSDYYGTRTISTIYTSAKVLEVLLPSILLIFTMRSVDRHANIGLALCFFYILALSLGLNSVILGRSFAVFKVLIMPVLYQNLYLVFKHDQFFILATPGLLFLYLITLYSHLSV